ncbi:MAG: class I SAM-dependent methyltransferase [Planctomycetaceae bacterium]
MIAGSSPASSSSKQRRSLWSDRQARRLVLGQMAALRGGRILLHEPCGTQTLGTPDTAFRESIECEVTIHNPRVYGRMLWGVSLGAAEGYIDGEWEVDDLTNLIRLFVRNESLLMSMDTGLARVANWGAQAWHWLRKNTPGGSRRNIAAHYDLGNDFFRLFLDETMMYSSGIFPHSEASLHEASVEKIDRVCRKLRLSPRDHLLEIGTGWGGFALHAAGTYGCRITTTTISDEQHSFATRRIAEAGLCDRVRVLKCDYRHLEGEYDKIASIEMIEAVGHEFLDMFFRKCGQLLKPDGMMLLQGIVMFEQRYQAYLKATDFIQRYVFPGGCLPTVSALTGAAARTSDLYPLHLEDFAEHYARTLRCWRERFETRLDEVRQLGFDDRFIRIWTYYFCYCEAAFQERYIGLSQLMLAKSGWRGDPIDVGHPVEQTTVRPPRRFQISERD